jgi:glycosyltransferase involved in cell wall biosynthesis
MIMPVLAVGGAEQVHLYMLEHLHESVRFVVVALEPHNMGVGTSADQFRRYTPYVYTTDDFLIHPLTYSWMQYLIERFQPETLYIANGANWIYDALSNLKSDYPNLRVANQVYDYQAGWINRYRPEFARLIDAHIGTNQRICAEYVRRGAKEEHVYLVEHCVDVAEYDPEQFSLEQLQQLRNRFGIPEGHRVVTFMARLHQQKRPVDFIEMARRLDGEPAITFLMVGDGPLNATVEDVLVQTQIANIIRLPFHRPSKEIFAVSDVYVLPSEYEGMPLVILEAQSMGVPVVVTDVGNNREVMDITKGGVVVDQIGDITGLRNGVLRMLANPPEPMAVRQAVIQDLSQALGILPHQMAEKYRKALLPPEPKRS